MKNKLIQITTVAILAGIALAGIALPALAVTAGTGEGVGMTASVGAGVGAAAVGAAANVKVSAATNTRIMDRADKEISRRIDALNALITRVGEMQKLSADEKTSLTSSIQAQIATLNDLKTKITA